MAATFDTSTILPTAVAAAGFIGAVYAGFQRGRKENAEDKPTDGSRFLGGVLMDNMSMAGLTEALKENTAASEQLHDDLRDVVHQIERVRDRL